MAGSIYRLLPAADDDLEDIFAFGLKQFGWQQAAHYATALGRVFQRHIVNLLYFPDVEHHRVGNSRNSRDESRVQVGFQG